MRFQIKPIGDIAIMAVFEQKIQEDISREVMKLYDWIGENCPEGIVELVPAFASLLIYYDPEKTGYAKLAGKLKRALESGGGAAGRKTGKTVEIPVCYGGKYGEDLAFVAEHAGLSEKEVIKIHSGREYRIYMLGFLPGFPYLGGMDERLITPRLEKPRTRIPAGSVGIGGAQTGIYPLESPGGWQLIGRTPLKLFDQENAGGLPYEAGDRIRFVPIGEQEFERRAGSFVSGNRK